MARFLKSNWNNGLLQIHIGVELHRVPELLFQPSMVGSIEAGLVETIDYVLRLFTPEEQMVLVNNVFLSGSCSRFPGLPERLSRELTEIRPFQSTHKVRTAEDATLDSWYGAQRYVRENELKAISIMREEYLEFGGDFLRTHGTSNRFYETPSPLPTPLNEPME